MRSSALLIGLVSCGLLVAGCSAPDQDPPAAAAVTVQVVEPAHALSLRSDGATVLDVRTPQEFAEGHLEGALNVDLQSGTFLEQVRELPADQPYVVYCASGNRSAQATAAMAGAGFADLYDAGGFDALAEEGAPVSAGGDH